ncbi:isochorismatase family protein [Micromonospora sp. CA-240977]|uniref:isochorismatase family protein n=1 Tax=Micromonospora sp. CA-240977 TaxID=3239957 RepID=UPI003D8D9903
MGIPPIVPYPMPGESDLPPAAVPWQLDPARAALLVHDMQRYFVDFFPDASPRRELVHNVSRLLGWARAEGVPVAYTAQPGAMTPAERGLLRDFWGPGMSADRDSREIIAELAPEPGDEVFTKWRYSAFARTSLGSWLARNGCAQLVVCGVYAHVGVLMTAVDAFSADVQPFLVGDAVADFTERDHHEALRYAARRCAMTVTTNTVLARRRMPAPA